MTRIPSSQRHGYGARHEEEGSARAGVAGFEGGVELEYWRERFGERPYGRGRGFEEYGPAFAYAVRVYPAAPGRSFEEVEGALEDGWHWHRAGSSLGWGEARLAVRDAWRRMAELGRRRSAMFDRPAAERLNGVIRALHDRRLGCQQAALELDSDEVRGVLLERAAESRRFIEELAGQVTACGERPAGSGTVLGSLGRGWSTLRRAAGAGDAAVLTACTLGEDETLGVYAATLRAAELQPEHRTALVRQQRRLQLEAEQLRGRLAGL